MAVLCDVTFGFILRGARLPITLINMPSTLPMIQVGHFLGKFRRVVMELWFSSFWKPVAPGCTVGSNWVSRKISLGNAGSTSNAATSGRLHSNNSTAKQRIAPSRARQNARHFQAFLERKRKAPCDRLVTRGNNLVPLDIQSEQPASNEKQEKPALDICAADLSENTSSR